jgi:hypothetical protein
MQRAPVPQAVQACHELAAWIIPQLEKFPRTQRFTLGERIETKLFDVLEQLLKASYSRQKREALQEANLQLEMLRHFWRLAYEIKVIALKRYEQGAKQMDGLGRQIGGWLKSRNQE